MMRNLISPGGISAVRNLIQSELNTLRQTPILLISSDKAPLAASDDTTTTSNKPIKSVQDCCQLLQFTLQQQYGLRVIESKISSGYPTTSDITQRLELLQRTSGHGSTPTIIGVGSGPAIDLTKAIQTTIIENNNNANSIPRTILIPSTYGGIVASGSSHSLILDSTEETLVPIPSSSTSKAATINTNTNIIDVITPMEAKYMEPLDDNKNNINLYACTAIVLDAIYRKSTSPNLPILIDTLIQEFTKDQNQNESSDDAEDTSSSKLLTTTSKLLYDSGSLLSYGLSNDDRSIPIALASSLIPRLFPEMHPLSFFASLVPGLCHIIKQRRHNKDRLLLQVINKKSIFFLTYFLKKKKRLCYNYNYQH